MVDYGNNPGYASNGSGSGIDRTIDHLNSFLRGELSAVETYRQAIAKLRDDPIVEQLMDCQRSHQARVVALEERIRLLGGEPSTSSGAWGAFAKLFEGGAKLFGRTAAIAALEEGEDHGRNDYLRDLDLLDAATREFVESDLLNEQQYTHDVMSRLKDRI